MAKEIVYRKLSDLKKLPNNPRTIKKDDMERLKKSIKDNPDYFEARPIILSNRTGELVILAGNQRYEAAKALKMDEVPTFLLEGLTEAREREIIIRDNVSNGDWDMDALANEWDTQELTDWGVDINWDEPEQEVVEDEAPEVNESEPAKSELGKVYKLGNHRLMCGDSTDAGNVAILMDGQKADMVFTDPPYGYQYESNYQDKYKMLKNDDRILDYLSSILQSLGTDCAIYSFCGWQSLRQWLEYFVNTGLDLKNVIIWKKNNWSMGDLKGAYAGQYEIILYLVKGRKEINGRRDTDIWEFDREPPRLHPTMKPIALIAKALEKSSTRNDKVLDLFGGSGSTLIACEQLDRKCYMMELDPKYCDVIRRRWWKFTHDGDEDGWEEGTPAI